MGQKVRRDEMRGGKERRQRRKSRADEKEGGKQKTRGMKTTLWTLYLVTVSPSLSSTCIPVH